ncbi:sas10 utp3 family protein [Colletotrichum musicola]|uniref:Sas10 utp3 family protein n=1 Tax=Colletotrichum musicola TaxID=2175873 RepID=A0A8H6NZX2_9PEZI|nr:sas10 utp3 family protein [Colletotrichum musicola]
MAKKRKASAPARSGPKELDPADARLGPITTYEDVANSEDEYFLNRDKIMFDEGPQSKRRKRADEEDKFLENSDEEVLDFDDGGDSDDDEEDTRQASRKSKKAKGKAAAATESDEEGQEEGNENDPSWWGASKKEYYNADQIETEADALEEEAEAKRLQQKKLAKMSEEDFLFDQGEWLASKPDAEEDQEEVVTEVLKDVEITDDMGPEERTKLLQSRYPEFEHLVNEFTELQPQLVTLQKEAHGKSSQSLEAVKYWTLGCYVAALASYFAILTSPARDGSTTKKTLDPAELRDHEVMETLLECRETWQQVKSAKAVQPVDSMDVSEEEVAPMDAEDEAAFEAAKQEARRLKKLEKAAKAKKKQAQSVEESLADLDDLLKGSKKSKKAKKAAKSAGDDDDNSDFGEEDALDARTAADKAARKKSLRFYTSQIVQKANKRADAGRDAGGDVDIPYRERLRDRQARLNAEAERRGQKGSKFGADLGDEGSDDDNDARTAAGVRDDGDDEYYDMVAAKSQKKKAEKASLYEALAAARKADRVVEQEVVGEDGKRKITYAIDKNKGLTPKRKKENRNPRVKKRMKYEEKQKKLRSMKAVWKGGEPKGGYSGEASGITTGIVRARKL